MCKGSLTWAGSYRLMPSSKGTWGSQGPFHHDFVLSSSPGCVIQVSACHGDSVLVLDEGQPLMSGLGIIPVLQSRVCIIILHMSRGPFIAMAPSHVDSLTVALPGLLVGSWQNCGKMLTQQVGRDGAKTQEVQGTQHGHMITD